MYVIQDIAWYHIYDKMDKKYCFTIIIKNEVLVWKHCKTSSSSVLEFVIEEIELKLFINEIISFKHAFCLIIM